MPGRHSWEDLAVFGGRPRFERPLHVNRPNQPNRDRLLERVDGLLDRRWYSNGILVEEFEDEVARVCGVRHCVATCNGTLALEVVLRAMDLSGEVILPAFTFVATAQALRWVGLTPVYCDVEPGTHSIDPRHAEQLITSRTSAILGVHMWGNACDVERLEDVADRNGLRLLLDAALAFGGDLGGRRIGGSGSAEVFSFHATKFINSAEGGAITTDDDALAARCRAATDYGFDDSDAIAGAGTNAKMSELCAAMGLTLLEEIEELTAANHATAGAYRDMLAEVPGVQLFEPAGRGRSNGQYVVTVVDETLTGISRDDILRTLEAENILAKRYFHPGCHRMSGADDTVTRLPVTDRLTESVLVLPGGASIDREEVRGVCESLRSIVENGAEIGRALRVVRAEGAS